MNIPTGFLKSGAFNLPIYLLYFLSNMLEVNFKNVYAWWSIGGVIDSCQSPNQQGDLNTKKDQISELPKQLTRTPFSGSRISGDIIQLCVSPGTHNPLILSRLVSLGFFLPSLLFHSASLGQSLPTNLQTGLHLS